MSCAALLTKPESSCAAINKLKAMAAFVWTKRLLQWLYSIFLSVYRLLISCYCEVDVGLCYYWTNQYVFSVGR